jgi:hypothetical protein
MPKTFIEKCICGEELISKINNYVADWHNSDNKQLLSEYLGMTDDEFFQFIKSENNLVNIIESRKNNIKGK